MIPFLDLLSDGTCLLRVYIQPRAAKNEIAGLHDAALKIRLTAPPVDGQANKAVIAFLAKLLHLPKSAITIKSGHQSRTKSVAIAPSGGKLLPLAAIEKTFENL